MSLPRGPDRAAGRAVEAEAGSDDDPPDDTSGLDIGDEPWAAGLADLDRRVASSGHALASTTTQGRAREPLVYDLDWDEDSRLRDWRAVVDATANLPPLLAAALVAQAWEDIAPLQHLPWLGRLLTAALLRVRAATRAHLLCLNTGLRALPRLHRPAGADPAARLIAWFNGMLAAAETGCKEHDRWLNARRQLERRLTGRRSTSNLPALIDLVLATPIASAGMIAKRLAITPRAVQNLVAELGLREATGRGRYRAWGIL